MLTNIFSLKKPIRKKGGKIFSKQRLQQKNNRKAGRRPAHQQSSTESLGAEGLWGIRALSFPKGKEAKSFPKSNALLNTLQCLILIFPPSLPAPLGGWSASMKVCDGKKNPRHLAGQTGSIEIFPSLTEACYR